MDSRKGSLVLDIETISSKYLLLHTHGEKVTEQEFHNVKWDFRKLSNYKPFRESAQPFTASLSELMRSRVIDC